jgi:hypothetical protein
MSSGPFAEKSVFCTESGSEFTHITRSLQAYLCAGFIDWASENLGTNSGMESGRALSVENGAENEEMTGCEGCQKKSVQWHGLLEVLKVCQTAVLTKENVQYFQDCVKIKKWELEIATAVAKSQKSAGETVNAVDDAGGNGDTDSVLLKLEELKQRRHTFERDYISTPNPFVTYCRMKTVICHFQEEDPEGCDDLHEQCEALWKSITSNV